MMAESMLWLLLTGQVPSEAQSRGLSRELAEKGRLPPLVEVLIDSYVVRFIVSRRTTTLM
jgi:citrate synthase